MVPKGTLRAPVSPFQTTVWHYGDSEHLGLGDQDNQNIDGGHMYNRERWKKRRGGEQTDNHRRPQATLIRMQTSICNISLHFLSVSIVTVSLSFFSAVFKTFF